MRALAVVLLAVACAPDETLAPAPCRTITQDDVFDVYRRSALDGLHAGEVDVLLLRFNTLTRGELQRFVDAGLPADADTALRDDLLDRADASYDLVPEELAWGIDVTTVDPFDYPDGVLRSDDSWQSFLDGYPGATFVLEISPPGFSCDDGLLFAVYQCGEECATGWAIGLSREDRPWTVTSATRMWHSGGASVSAAVPP